MDKRETTSDIQRLQEYNDYCTQAFRTMYELMWNDADSIADVLMRIHSPQARRSLSSVEQSLRKDARKYSDLSKIKTKK